MAGYRHSRGLRIGGLVFAVLARLPRRLRKPRSRSRHRQNFRPCNSSWHGSAKWVTRAAMRSP